ncbi:NtaA/DmoA family FMN-dependent monooxygenase [Nocardiopsis sp. NPDC006198]|uniref:NtaA/DmoA family FMN-dependent monooxygenase n=1 Tax=Nocardiopsis sp. NPDC006198 TaxID=3154472 RepID=UPI0033A0662F
MTGKHMILGVGLANNFGVHPAAWRLPDVDPGAYADIAATVRQAQAAERGGLHFIFLAERLFLHGDLATEPPLFNMDPLTSLTAVSQATERVGLIGTASTSFNEPYLLARQLKTMDVVSRGRVGWNAVPSFEPDAFANAGRQLPPREQKYERLHEVLQVVHALWGSWGREAGRLDQGGMFADPAHIRPVDLRGEHVGSRGPLPVPPSEQGQPVVVMPLSSGYGLQAAAMYANVVIAMPMSIEQALEQRAIVRRAVEAAGRDPQEVRFITFAKYEVAATAREALDRIRAMDELRDLRPSLSRLGSMLGLPIGVERSDAPLTAKQLAMMNPAPGHAPSQRAARLARERWSPRDILAHGALDPFPSVVGTPAQAADHLQEWFEAGAADGFLLNFASFHHGIDAFVDGVVPVLRERRLFPEHDEKPRTLREHLSLPDQYGLDPRVSSSAD